MDADATLLSPVKTAHNETVHLATSPQEIRQAQALRYQVFAEEMGAVLHGEEGYDVDHYDQFCHHLLVKDRETQQIIGCTRILTSDQVGQAGGFYSESEFDLTPIFTLPGRFMEIGRTCIHPDYRNSHVLGLLWSGLAQFMVMGNFNYLMGCASIPMSAGYEHSSLDRLQSRYAVATHLQVQPRYPLQARPESVSVNEEDVVIPALLKAYLRLGAQICGAPCWDADFKVADLFILLDMANLQRRYARHFVERVQPKPAQHMVFA
ncbi:GNAT family N-acetyltransferase [Thioflexithrix psekupsensis]|uniref:L-ornithine N(alpha)-acyltransferase n=1 Tax=Thioflexithrix psekupsensis TaxID=1570016 RepID=A0A251X8V1_9GAMM|nr:GNAT family N-acyltransferase [Thioflexithrix psekupsensis]OUD14426.1 hemolysin [Thioflexithrix psekupsensis]